MVWCKKWWYKHNDRHKTHKQQLYENMDWKRLLKSFEHTQPTQHTSVLSFAMRSWLKWVAKKNNGKYKLSKLQGMLIFIVNANCYLLSSRRLKKFRLKVMNYECFCSSTCEAYKFPSSSKSIQHLHITPSQRKTAMGAPGYIFYWLYKGKRDTLRLYFIIGG